MAGDIQNYDQMMRLMLVGSSSVGKTCLLRRFNDGTFSNSFVPTIGIDFAVKYMDIDNKKIKVQIFDTAGQERFKSIVSSYFRQADVFDVSCTESFQDIDQYWLNNIQENTKSFIKLILIGKIYLIDQQKGNKIDIEDRQIKTEKETSALTEFNVQEAFEAIIKDVYFRKKVEQEGQKQFEDQKNNKQLIKNEQKNKNDQNCC